MYETPDELAALQALIDASFARAGAHTTSIISAERRLSAEEVAAYLVGAAWRIKHLEQRPAVSATHFVGDDIAVTVHGRAHIVIGATPEADDLRPTWQAIYEGGSPEDWVPEPSMARYVRIDAQRMLTYCFDRSKLKSLIGQEPSNGDG